MRYCRTQSMTSFWARVRARASELLLRLYRRGKVDSRQSGKSKDGIRSKACVGGGAVEDRHELPGVEERAWTWRGAT